MSTETMQATHGSKPVIVQTAQVIIRELVLGTRRMTAQLLNQVPIEACYRLALDAPILNGALWGYVNYSGKGDPKVLTPELLTEDTCPYYRIHILWVTPGGALRRDFYQPFAEFFGARDAIQGAEYTIHRHRDAIALARNGNYYVLNDREWTLGGKPITPENRDGFIQTIGEGITGRLAKLLAEAREWEELIAESCGSPKQGYKSDPIMKDLTQIYIGG